MKLAPGVDHAIQVLPKFPVLDFCHCQIYISILFFWISNLYLRLQACSNIVPSALRYPVYRPLETLWSHHERARHPSANVLYAPSSTATVLLGGGTDLMADLVQVLSEATELEQLLDPGTESRRPCCI